MSSDVDAASLLRALDGDAEAFGDFFDTHGAGVLRWLQVRTADFSVAADLCAETFAAALESLDRYDQTTGTPTAWLYGIARHKHQHWLRSENVERRARERLKILLPGHHSDDLDLIELRADLAGMIGPLEEGLARLPDGTRNAVKLRILAELPYSQVATHLGCSEGAARVRVSRGLDMLLAHLEAEVTDQ